ncbi:MAG: hypothetical protein KDE62_13315, partial [Calditrichaeota bacterium]|nr:hypothetical protein [Calditrichota bacterium]
MLLALCASLASLSLALRASLASLSLAFRRKENIINDARRAYDGRRPNDARSANDKTIIVRSTPSALRPPPSASFFSIPPFL